MPGAKTSGDLAHTRALWTANRPREGSAPAYTRQPPLWWQAALSLAAALLLQSSLAPLLTVRGASPPLVLLVVVWYALRAGALRGLAFGLLAGACEDASAGTTGAAWTLATGLAGLGAGRFARTWAADMPPALGAAAAFFTLARYGAFAVVMQAEGHPVALPVIHVHAALWQSAEAALIAVVLLRVLPDLAGNASLAPGLHAHRR